MVRLARVVIVVAALSACREAPDPGLPDIDVDAEAPADARPDRAPVDAAAMDAAPADTAAPTEAGAPVPDATASADVSNRADGGAPGAPSADARPALDAGTPPRLDAGSGAAPDARPDAAAMDAPTRSDAASPAPGAPLATGYVACGAGSCALASAVCCAPATGPAACIARGAEASCGGVVRACDQPGDCARGQVCCARVPQRNPSSLAPMACEAPAACNGAGVHPLCASTADCPADRPYCCPVFIDGRVQSACSAVRC